MVAQGEERDTTLTAWFKLNAAADSESDVRKLRYAEIPEHYAWVQSKRHWKKRQSTHHAEHVIGRLMGAGPAEGPRFYLYLLLLHKPGATGFQDLATVNGVEYKEVRLNLDTGAEVPTDVPDYRAAAVALGLVQTDDEYYRALDDAVQVKTPAQLRMLFAHLLLYCEVKDPALMFGQYYKELAQDKENVFGRDSGEAKDATLLDLQELLARGGRTLEDFFLPLPEGYDLAALQNRDLAKETAYDRTDESERGAAKRNMMYPAQAEAFDARTTLAASSSLSAVARDAASLSSNAFGGVGCSSDSRASRATLASSARTHCG